MAAGFHVAYPLAGVQGKKKHRFCAGRGTVRRHFRL